MRIHTAILLAVGLTAASPAAAQGWRVSGLGGEAPDRTVYLVDANSIVRSGDKINFTTSTIWERVTADRDFDRSVTKREGSCAAGSSAIVQNSYYRAGKLISTDTNRSDVVKHGDGSLMQSAIRQACGQEDYVTDPVADPEPLIRQWMAEDE